MRVCPQLNNFMLQHLDPLREDGSTAVALQILLRVLSSDRQLTAEAVPPLGEEGRP